MNKTGYSFNTSRGESSRIDSLIATIVKGGVTPSSLTGVESLSSVFGAENFSLGESNKMTYGQRQATLSATKAVFDSNKFLARAKDRAELIKSAGFESFSLQLDEGSVAEQKAATIELNAEANRQFPAAEAMYPTVQIGYEDVMLELPVDVAGVGTYNINGNGFDAYEEFRPIVSTLTDETYNPGDDLKVVPVFVNDKKDKAYTFFVDPALWPADTEHYDSSDLLNRESHLTNFLRPVKIDNIMNICQAPGAAKWQQDDEIESGSIRVKRVLFKVKTKDGEGVFALDTSKFAGNAMRTGASLNSKSERQLILKTVLTEPKALTDKSGKDATSLFASLGNNVPALQWQIQLTYNRDTRGINPTVSQEVSIHHVTDPKGNRLVANSSKTSDEVNELIANQAVEATIVGYELAFNHNNRNWSRYGQTVVYSSTNKQYYVRERTPLYVKYPMADDVTNSDVLSKCVKSMGLMISRNMTFDAFKEANEHIDYLMANNNKKIVNINEVSNDVLPGQFYFNTTARDDKFNLSKTVSTLDTKDALGNIQAALVNKITDVITDIRVRSGFSAIKEVDGREEEYTIVAHAALAPFLITTGDVRTFGQNVKFKVIETNIPTEVGTFWIFPTSTTKDGTIDAFGGLGFCVSRELLVIEGDVRMSERQFRMMITQPAYQHHSTGVIAGRVVIEDIADLMAGGGVLTSINKLLVEVSGKIEGAGGNNGGSGASGNEVDIDPGKG